MCSTGWPPTSPTPCACRSSSARTRPFPWPRSRPPATRPCSTGRRPTTAWPSSAEAAGRRQPVTSPALPTSRSASSPAPWAACASCAATSPTARRWAPTSSPTRWPGWRRSPPGSRPNWPPPRSWCWPATTTWPRKTATPTPTGRTRSTSRCPSATPSRPCSASASPTPSVSSSRTSAASPGGTTGWAPSAATVGLRIDHLLLSAPLAEKCRPATPTRPPQARTPLRPHPGGRRDRA
jgi:hypothetical protein